MGIYYVYLIVMGVFWLGVITLVALAAYGAYSLWKD